jgi:hypothetical protein
MRRRTGENPVGTPTLGEDLAGYTGKLVREGIQQVVDHSGELGGG